MSVRARHSNTLLERREVETEDVADLGSGKGRIVVQAAPRYRYFDPEEHKQLVAAGPVRECRCRAGRSAVGADRRGRDPPRSGRRRRR